MATKEGKAIEAPSEDEARQNQTTDQQRNVRTSVNGRCVFHELANWQCEVPELQMSSKIVLGSL